MRHGFVKLSFFDDGDGTGKLSVEAESAGYAGKSGAYFGIGQIQEFAEAISQFPLPDLSRCSLAGGFYSKDKDGALEQEHVGIVVYPIDRRGHIGVQVRMATELWNDTRPESQRTTKLEIITSYEPISKFGRDLLAMLKGDIPVVMLEGDALH